MVGVVPWDPQALTDLQDAERQKRLVGVATAPQNSAKAPAAAAAAAVPTAAASTMAAAAVAAAAAHTVREVLALDMSRLTASQLPELVCETIAEHRRRRGWQRVFPCPEEPERYLDLFEVPRAANLLVARAAVQLASG
jgi:hypothetical protein